MEGWRLVFARREHPVVPGQSPACRRCVARHRRENRHCLLSLACAKGVLKRHCRSAATQPFPAALSHLQKFLRGVIVGYGIQCVPKILA